MTCHYTYLTTLPSGWPSRTLRYLYYTCPVYPHHHTADGTYHLPTWFYTLPPRYHHTTTPLLHGLPLPATFTRTHTDPTPFPGPATPATTLGHLDDHTPLHRGPAVTLHYCSHTARFQPTHCHHTTYRAATTTTTAWDHTHFACSRHHYRHALPCFTTLPHTPCTFLRTCHTPLPDVGDVAPSWLTYHHHPLQFLPSPVTTYLFSGPGPLLPHLPCPPHTGPITLGHTRTPADTHLPGPTLPTPLPGITSPPSEH